MVFFNYAAMQVTAKIVYYGPGLCGKTTNLKKIYDQTTPSSRGEIVSLETETDRTLFFDLLPIDVGVIGGFRTKFQLYTVPGQVFYNVTRKLVLKGVDGIVFVADSQAAMLDANVASFKNLRDNLKELGIPLEKTPIVLQYNKRDLENVSTLAEMENALNPFGKYVSIQSSALTGEGVFETLKEISRQTLFKLRNKVVDQKERKKRESMVSFKIQTEELSGEDLSDIEEEIEIKELTEGSFSPLDNTNSDAQAALVIAESESSLPSLSPQDMPVYDASAGESSLPSLRLTDIENQVDEIVIDSNDEFGITGSGWDDENELTLDFDLPSNDPIETPEMVLDEAGNDKAAMDEDTQKSREEHSPDNLGSMPVEIPSEPNSSNSIETPIDRLSEETGSALMDLDSIETEFEESEIEVLEAIGSELEIPEPELLDKLDDSFELEHKPRSKHHFGSRLDELTKLTQTHSRKTGKSRQKTDILGDFLSAVSPRKRKEKRIRVRAPRPFHSAQLNCILVDKSNNVIHTQLVKVNPVTLPDGKKEIRVVLDVEVEKE